MQNNDAILKIEIDAFNNRTYSSGPSLSSEKYELLLVYLGHFLLL